MPKSASNSGREEECTGTVRLARKGPGPDLGPAPAGGYWQPPPQGPAPPIMPPPIMPRWW